VFIVRDHWAKVLIRSAISQQRATSGCASPLTFTASPTVRSETVSIAAAAGWKTGEIGKIAALSDRTVVGIGQLGRGHCALALVEMPAAMASLRPDFLQPPSIAHRPGFARRDVICS